MIALPALLVMAIALANAPAVSSMDFTEGDLASKESLWALYERWCAHYSVARDMGEEARRFDVFEKNVLFVHEFNNKGDDAPYKLRLNHFADTAASDEFTPCYKKKHSKTSKGGRHQGSRFRHGALAERDLPKEVDWRMRRIGGRPGCVTDVKYQTRQCGSCWAFATTAAMEGLSSIVTDRLIPLSEQQLIDCNSENDGCGGGDATAAFDYIKEVGGLAREADYPYTAKQGTCTKHPSAALFPIDGYEEVPASDEVALMKAVSQQPVVASIDGSGAAFALYGGGVFRGPCGMNTTHQVAVIGYGKDYDSGTGLDYWLIKNSWGASWGEHGYMRLSREVTADKGGMCGILMEALYPFSSFEIGRRYCFSVASWFKDSTNNDYQSVYYYKNMTRVPSPYLIKRLREQEALQRWCGPGTEPYTRASERLQSGATDDVDGCSYLVLISYRGLGNRVLSTASAFLYALITNRVLLVDPGHGNTFPRAPLLRAVPGRDMAAAPGLPAPKLSRWAVMRFYNAYLRNADERLGIQIRVFDSDSASSWIRSWRAHRRSTRYLS
ncbi:hypothetical protein EJB05_44554, partial [Eragrostis curvula]